MEESRLRRLLDVGRSLIAELDPDVVLERLLEVAQELTGARYAAIGVLDERREALEQFLTKGIDEDTHRAIGDLPHGRGVLGVLIRDPRPLRLADVESHPESYGFPLAHPPMHTFLGVPIVVHGEAWGNLYLTEKAGGEFTRDDEDSITVLADWAAIAIANSRLYRDVRQRRDELQRANRGLETTTEIARALGGVTDLDRVLELVVKRSRALIDARAAELALVDAEELLVAAVAGQGVEGVRGTRLPVEQSVAGAALRSGRAQRFRDVPDDTFARRALGARTALVTPMMFRNRAIGFLSVFDRLSGDGSFSEEDERLLQAFAASAATAVATAQSASSEALQRSVEASEQERRRWARELHDETLQELAGLKVMLSGARRSEDPARLDAAVDRALQLLTHGIENLRSLITELRPAALDELGTEPAVHALVQRVREHSGLEIELESRLAYEQGRASARHTPEIEVAIYRIVQEALTNVVKHAGARHVWISITDPEGDDGPVCVAVRDDGQGFESARGDGGFGLVGMRERIALVHGELEVTSAPGEGTRIVARIPLERRPAAATPSATPAT
jgi:two-component system, NarL family, sensor histidine kinase DevS